MVTNLVLLLKNEIHVHNILSPSIFIHMWITTPPELHLVFRVQKSAFEKLSLYFLCDVSMPFSVLKTQRTIKLSIIFVSFKVFCLSNYLLKWVLLVCCVFSVCWVFQSFWSPAQRLTRPKRLKDSKIPKLKTITIPKNLKRV